MRRVHDRTLAGELALAMHAASVEAGRKPTALGTAFRHSDAMGCARSIALTALNIDQEPMDLPGVWVTGIGTMLHEKAQDALVAAIDSEKFEVEVEKKCQSFEDGSGHIDLYLRERETSYTIVDELKSCNGVKFRALVGSGQFGKRVTPKPPALNNRVQVALNGKAVNADEVRLSYMATEAIAVGKGFEGLDRISAEYVMGRDEYEPLADAEIARVRGILVLARGGVVPDRIFPDDNGNLKKVNPSTDKWPCHYCFHRSTCERLGAGEKSVGQL